MFSRSLEGRFKLKLSQSMELCEFVMKHPPIQKDKLNLVTSSRYPEKSPQRERPLGSVAWVFSRSGMIFGHVKHSLAQRVFFAYEGKSLQ